MSLDTNINEPAENKSKESILSFLKRHCLLTSIFLVLGAGVASAQMWKEGRSDVCGGSDLVHIKFGDIDKTEFLIPKPYFDRPEDLNSSLRISSLRNGEDKSLRLKMKLENFDAKCDQTEVEDGNKPRFYIPIHLKSYTPNKLSGLLDTQKLFYPQSAVSEGTFFVFRSKDFKLGGSMAKEQELFIPKDKNLVNKYFMVCNWGFEGQKIVGCTVTQHITKGVYANYIIDELQVKNLDTLVPKIDQKIISFIK